MRTRSLSLSPLISLRFLQAHQEAVDLRSVAVYEVSAVSALQKFSELLLAQNLAANPNQQHVFLFFGVNGQAGPEFALERTGWNDCSFRVPDERGWQPDKQPIIPANGTIEQSFKSALPLEAIQRVLVSRDFAVKISDDPGRFLCNFVRIKKIYQLWLFYILTRRLFLRSFTIRCTSLSGSHQGSHCDLYSSMFLNLHSLTKKHKSHSSKSSSTLSLKPTGTSSQKRPTMMLPLGACVEVIHVLSKASTLWDFFETYCRTFHELTAAASALLLRPPQQLIQIMRLNS